MTNFNHQQQAIEQYWPYAINQKACTAELITRFKTWKRSVNTLLLYFTTLSKLEKQVIDANLNMGKALQVHQSDLGESCEGVFNHWSQLSAQNVKNSTSSESQINSLVMKRLEYLKADIKKKTYSFEMRLGEYQKSINKARINTLTAIGNHEAHILHRQQSTIGSISPHYTFDPWLQERFLQEHLQCQIAAENKFQKNMTDLFQEMSIFDAHVVEELKRVLEEYALVKNSSWTTMQAQMTVIVNQGVQLNPLICFQKFSNQFKLNDPNLWIKERTIEEFSRKPKEIKIVKQGLLYRPSKLGMGLWVPLLCVLTETGYFHTFAIPSKQKYLIQFFLKRDLDRSNPATLSRDLNVVDEKDYLKDHGRPELSISLGQPRISVDPVAKKSVNHVFEFTILQRKAKTLLTKASEQTTHYEFRALSEADMIEWIAIVQKSLQSLFPAGPPSPLFRSQKSIEEKIAQVMNIADASILEADNSNKSLLRIDLEGKSLDNAVLQKMDSSITVHSTSDEQPSGKSLDLTMDTDEMLQHVSRIVEST